MAKPVKYGPVQSRANFYAASYERHAKLVEREAEVFEAAYGRRAAVTLLNIAAQLRAAVDLADAGDLENAAWNAHAALADRLRF